MLSLSRKSCTILINGKEVCIHDGTWKSCEVRVCVSSDILRYSRSKRVVILQVTSSDKSMKNMTS